MIFAGSYTVISSSMFIICNTPSASRYGQWRIFKHAIPTSTGDHSCYYNRHVKIVWLRESRSFISATMPAAQSSINRPPPSIEKGILIRILFQSVHILQTPVIPVTEVLYGSSFSISWFFSIKGFHVNPMCLSFLCYILSTCTIPFLFLDCGENRPSNHL